MESEIGAGDKEEVFLIEIILGRLHNLLMLKVTALILLGFTAIFWSFVFIDPESSLNPLGLLAGLTGHDLGLVLLLSIIILIGLPIIAIILLLAQTLKSGKKLE